MAKFCKDPNYVRLIQSTKWRKLRNTYIQEHPICERCGQYLATEVHHIVPLTRFTRNPDKMEEMAFDEENLQALCHDCHIKAHIELGKYKYSIQNSKKFHKQEVEEFFKQYFGEDGEDTKSDEQSFKVD